ncbi:MAG TPA: TIGR00341 family protein [Flavobacteriaceae bacterium]|nr:TIGR00341 family protein [Flavobacteriaceae bacterium]HBS11951.1 TIGR00341 family protein [Flavobacteriaceae bacterium]
MEENQQEEIDLEVKTEEAKKKVTGLLASIKEFMSVLLDIKTNTDRAGAVQTIKDGISMQGHTAWILVFSILIASIGLNANSAAVVIGAMLISPLMGPILGIGLSFGTNDMETLRRSMINLGVMVGLSLLTSFLFFSIPWFQEATPEILARIRPDVRDVFIALAGGLALIIAITRPSPQTNTVAGVAIATALMPPLCAAGYGLAVYNWTYFFGAMFLFIINTIFIALATFVIVEFLNFPNVKYINYAKQKKVVQFASLIAFVILAISVWQFYGLFKENQFHRRATNFVKELKENGISIIDEDEDDYDFNSNTINLVVFGRNVSGEELQKWNEKLPEFGLNETVLNIRQSTDNTDLRAEVKSLSELYTQNQRIIISRDDAIKNKEDKIRLLENELSHFYNNQVPFKEISKEARINYDNLERISYAKRIKTDFNTIDSLTVFGVKWKDKVARKTVDKQEQKLKMWLKVRLKLDTLMVVRE